MMMMMMKNKFKKVDITLKVIAIIATIVVCSLVLLVINAALNKHWRITNSINSQPNTQWISEDGTIVFNVDPNGKSTGTMYIGEDNFDFYLVEFMGVDITIYPINVLEQESINEMVDKYEYWSCSYKSKKKFVATVEKTTFFEKGQKITFYRIDNEGAEQTGDGSNLLKK